ncbi:uroporphyrinogen-III synthase [Idiomarina sp. HP20-50]|uniref:uroporphyrinogen-III synthase n=1 Tax=Idiomarina sp. HP20-50 TaxID=3070813 RepID=UPI00294B12D5|nr:uroporphyrinogen-III synthase [Idiomarina sp. HP20-50]MDV6316549.1 uroporphyrinogen-III synthase [Idiomarina sp. HP20-50]
MTMNPTTPKAVLLLRPGSAPDAFTRQLKQAGREYFVHSFIEIEPLTVNKEQLRRLKQQHWDGIVIVSRNAAHYAAKAGFTGIPSRYYAVGPGTASFAARHLNTPVSCPAFMHQSEGLLELSELQKLHDQNWLIIRGEGGRELLADALRARGASVDYWEVYRRKQLTMNNPELIQQWIKSVGTIVVTSAEQLGYFLSSMPHSAQTWLDNCQWIVPSHRLKGLIPFGQSDNIKVTGSAADAILMNALIADGKTHD